MFNFKFGRCKSTLQKTFSNCFDPLKDELGTVPLALHESKYVTASIISICEAYACHLGLKKTQQQALLVDATFEEIFRRESTSILIQTDNWKDSNDEDFTRAYQDGLSRTQKNLDEDSQLNLDWLKEHLITHYERSTNLML